MSTFLIIAPSEYTKVDRDEWMNATGIPFESWNGLGQEMIEVVQNSGVVPEGKYIVEIITIEYDIYVKMADIGT